MKFAWLNLFWIVPALIVLTAMHSTPKKVIHVPVAEAAERAVLCNENSPQKVRVSVRRVTVINFPFKPKDVVPGEVSFDFKKIKNDLVIKALRAQASTNLVVYLEDRRCVFDLVAVSGSGDDILTVEDPKDARMEVPFHD